MSTGEDNLWIGWTIVGVAAIAGVYLIAALIFKNAHDNAEKSRQIRIEKIRACSTIQDQALKTLCVLEGGARDPKAR
jgi:hypothetical protein